MRNLSKERKETKQKKAQIKRAASWGKGGTNSGGVGGDWALRKRVTSPGKC